MKRSLLMIAALTGTLFLAGCDDAKEAEQDNAENAQAEQTEQASTSSDQETQSEASVTRSLEGVLEFSATDVPLPDGAEVTVSLRDISRADAPATTIAETTVTPGNEDPVEFHLDYDTADVKPEHTHGLRAALHGDKGELLWTTTSRHTVDVGPDAKQGPITLVLEPVNTTPDGESCNRPSRTCCRKKRTTPIPRRQRRFIG